AGFWSTSADTSIAFARSVEAISARATTTAVSFVSDANDAARRVIAQATDARRWRQAAATLEMAARGSGRDVQPHGGNVAAAVVAPLHASGPSVDIDLGTLPGGKSITVVFDVTVDSPPVASYSNHATISSTTASFSPVDTNTVTTPGDRFNTSTTLTSSLNPADQGTPVTFTATVTPTEVSGLTPDGNVQFQDGVTALGGPLTCVDQGNNTCSAQLTTSSLTGGPHSITAAYLGGTNHDPSTSNAVAQVINVCTANPVVTTNADGG